MFRNLCRTCFGPIINLYSLSTNHLSGSLTIVINQPMISMLCYQPIKTWVYCLSTTNHNIVLLSIGNQSIISLLCQQPIRILVYCLWSTIMMVCLAFCFVFLRVFIIIESRRYCSCSWVFVWWNCRTEKRFILKLQELSKVRVVLVILQ